MQSKMSSVAAYGAHCHPVSGPEQSDGNSLVERVVAQFGAPVLRAEKPLHSRIAASRAGDASAAAWRRRTLLAFVAAAAVFAGLYFSSAEAPVPMPGAPLSPPRFLESTAIAAADAVPEGTELLTADGLRTPRGELAYSLLETSSKGFHRIVVGNLAAAPGTLGRLDLLLQPMDMDRSRLSIEYIEGVGGSMSYRSYGGADVDLARGRISGFGSARDVAIRRLEGDWYLVSIGVPVTRGGGSLAIVLEAGEEGALYEGEAGKGVILAMPRWSSWSAGPGA